MSRKAIYCLGLVATIGALAAVTAPALAQDMRTLEIRDGVVRLDGREVPGDRLPESLQTGDVELQFAWSGESEPVIEIGGRYYTLEANEIREVDADMQRDARQRFFDALGSVSEGTWYSTGADDQATKKQVEALRVQAREMAELSEQVSRERIADREHLADEFRRQAEVAEKMAAELPRMNVVTYWDAVRQTDEALYNRLVEEYYLESRIQELAARVRALGASSQREEMVSELKTLLDEAFELKQENRRREIGQLKNELQSLQDRLNERESLREEIIQRRLRELVGRL